MNDPNTSPNPAIPTVAQLSEARSKQWHQQGEALLTIENLRSWLNATGLVLFTPKPQIVSPAPSLVEAVLGASKPTPTIAETSEARSLLARLIADGLAVPLNLLGVTSGAVGETPDFIASTAVFSYVFTLRGDKAWKQPPTATGALKVSNLAVAAHEALTRRGPLTAYDLTTELGKEVTEAAVLRALAELWTHLRVLPRAQLDGRPAIWELSSARFLKQIKAGANAGQPSALSALISLYLGQAVVASEDEIEGFLSPLAPRSRIRDVVHALLAARQLDTLAIEGRTMLHVAGALPAFLVAEPEAVPQPDLIVVDSSSEASVHVEVGEESGEPSSRITKYVPKPRKIGTGYLAKAKPAFGSKPFSGAKSDGFKTRSGPAPDRERRPFAKRAASGAPRSFDKPWEEEKARRLSAASRPSDGHEAANGLAASSDVESKSATPIRAPRVYKPREDERRAAPSSGRKPAFGSKPAFGDRPAFGSKPAFGSRIDFGGRPKFESDSRPPRRDFARRPEGDAGEVRPPRKTFSKPGTFGRKREGFDGKPSFAGGESRPPRRDFAPRADRGERREGGDRAAFAGSRSSGTYPPRTRADRTQGARSPRPEGSGFAPRKSFGSKPASGGSGGRSSFSKDRSDRPSFKPREGSDRPAYKPREGSDRFTSTDSGKRVYRKFDAPRGERPARREGGTGFTGKPAEDSGERRSFSRPEGSTGRPSGSFAKKADGDFAPRRPSGKPGGGSFGKKPYAKAAGKGFGENSTSTFAKFAGNKKPFGKKAPARKYKPKEE